MNGGLECGGLTPLFTKLRNFHPADCIQEMGFQFLDINSVYSGIIAYERWVKSGVEPPHSKAVSSHRTPYYPWPCKRNAAATAAKGNIQRQTFHCLIVTQFMTVMIPR